jgi:hypothetical protein
MLTFSLSRAFYVDPSAEALRPTTLNGAVPNSSQGAERYRILLWVKNRLEGMTAIGTFETYQLILGVSANRRRPEVTGAW